MQHVWIKASSDFFGINLYPAYFSNRKMFSLLFFPLLNYVHVHNSIGGPLVHEVSQHICSRGTTLPHECELMLHIALRQRLVIQPKNQTGSSLNVFYNLSIAHGNHSGDHFRNVDHIGLSCVGPIFHVLWIAVTETKLNIISISLTSSNQERREGRRHEANPSVSLPI